MFPSQTNGLQNSHRGDQASPHSCGALRDPVCVGRKPVLSLENNMSQTLTKNLLSLKNTRESQFTRFISSNLYVSLRNWLAVTVGI